MSLLVTLKDDSGDVSHADMILQDHSSSLAGLDEAMLVDTIDPRGRNIDLDLL
eukprot:IDg16188t1